MWTLRVSASSVTRVPARYATFPASLIRLVHMPRGAYFKNRAERESQSQSYTSTRVPVRTHA